MYIYLDESGNFKGDKDEYFIIGGFVTSDPRSISKAFRKWQQSKFIDKRLRYRTEVKFTDTRLTDTPRLNMLVYLAQQNIRIFYTFLNTKNIPLEFRQHKSVETGHLYVEIVERTLDLILPVTDPEFRAFLDRRRLKGVSQSEFREHLKAHLLLSLPAKTVIQIESVDSTTSPNIQIADWICGALYRYYTKRTHSERLYQALKPKIIAAEELFQDYWTNKKSPPQ